MMSAADETVQTPPDEGGDSRGKLFRSGKEKKKRRRSRSKQKETGDLQFFDPDYQPFVADDNEDNSCSSTPKYERNFDELAYPVGGTKCALCYCGERSLLGQGDLTRYSPTPGFNPFKKPPLRARGSRELLYGSSPGSNGSQDGYNVGEKVTKTAAVQRRGSKQIRESVKPLYKQEDYSDELSTVGCSEVLEVSQVFEATGHVTAHHCCAAWSEGVTQNESYHLLCVDKAVHMGMSQRCHSCSRYGATVKCRAPKCERLFHYPCAAGSGCFQDIKSMSLLCIDHLELAPTIADPDELSCAVCDDPGQICDLLFCTSCGHHYHGDCLDPHVDVNPVVRAGWQCPECKICQTCRQPGDDNKMLVCDVCDKGYHTFCLRPAMTFIPKNGWCCKNCRRCTDCGSRTPGNGPSSRWHINYQVCDSCYQLRNKGSSCPVCGKAYRNLSSQRVDMNQCKDCKKWVHWTCEDSDTVESGEKPGEEYTCPRCRNPSPSMDDTQPMEELPQDQVIESPMLPEGNPTFISTPPPSESGGPENIEEQEGYVGMPEEVKQCNELSFQSPVPIARKRASTSSSMGSDKASFALKGSSLDPMLGLGEENASDSFESQSIAKSNLESPPRKIRHLSSDGTISMKLKQERHSSAESNLSSIFADDSQQSTISLFGVEPLQTTISPKFIPAQPTEMASSDSKFYSPDQFTLSNQPKVERSASNSPIHYGSPPVRPPGPGMGKPGGMFGKGKPFGHKRKPGGPRTSRGKGKGKGQKRGGFSGPRKRQKGAMLTGVNNSAGGNNTMNAGRSMPRRSRSRFHRQCNSTTQMPESDPSSPAKVEPLLQQIPPADDEYGDSMHNTVVLCSTEDCFTLSQDMCVVCGSFGKGSEGRLIACSQCGQCYHPYCVNLKLTKVVLRKGWRCLDCTVCEECGQVDDPAHLLLCDDCDISYHTQCLRPPLQQVPKGGWKCKWCVRCLHCGTTSPGTNSEWASNYTACGPCASLTHCPRCRRSYKDDDIIMQCGTCERWIHAICEQLYTDSDIEKVLEKGYECCFCRPKDSVPPHLSLVPALPPGEDMYGAGQGMYLGRTRSEVEIVKEYPKDYTTLTITGLQHIQRQMQKYMGLHKKRPAGPKRRGQKMDMKQKLQVQGGAVTQSPTLVGSGKKEEMAQDSQNTGEELVKEELTDQQAILNQGLDCMADASSATATATEESGLEGNLNDQEVSGMLASSIISPDNLETMSSNADYMESGHPDTTKSTPDVQQTSLKKRRKPYRPGIGGFMVRQRGRGGGLLKPRSRRMHRSRVATTEQSSTNDTKSDTLPSETASEGVGPPVPKTDASINPELPTAKLKVEDVAGTPTSATSADTKPQDQTSTNIPSLKLKIPSQHSSKTPGKRKKRVRLIDQFPPYLQDAFFGKKIITDAKENTNPAQNLDEKPASPGLSYGPKQPNTSCLVLPDRLTQRLEAQAIAQSAALSSSSHTHSTDARSGRHLNQSQDEESAMTEHETEQELLRLLPDIPLRDEELLAFFRQDLKQEQGNTDSHENILSPSALEKMVSGLDHMDGNDMADLFSDVLSHHQEGTNKQDNVPMVQDSTSHEPSQSTHQHVQHKTEGKTQQDTVNEGQAYQQPAVTTLPSQEAKSTVPQQQHEKHQHGLIIQQELQQLQQQYQQKQLMMRQEQLMQNTPQANYCLPQSSHTPPSQNLGHVDVHQGMVSNMPQIQSGPTIGMPAHHIDPNRSHSHHGTPVMSPMPNTQHPLSQIHQPSHSPLATPTPGMGQVTHFMRQGSIPSGMHSGMHTPTAAAAAAAGPNEGVSVQQLQQHLQVHMQQQNIGVTSTSPTVTQSKGAVSGHLPHNEIRQSAVTGTYQQQQGVPTSTYSQHTSDPYPGTAPAPTSSFSQQAPQVPSQLPTHMHNVPGAYTQQRSIGAESYMSNNEAGLVQHHISMTPSQQVPKSISMHQVVASYAQQASNAVATSLTAPSTMQTVMHQTLMTTTHTTISASPAKAVIATEPTQKIEDVLVPTQLPDFTGLGRDTSLFEPSPRPWPLGTELEGDSLSVNQRNILKWEKDEPLGELATISPVLYANVKHKNLKKEFPDWPTRAKQVAKLWRKASSDERAPFLIKARDNRALLKANRARRGDDISVTKTPTPPLPTEELDVKPVELVKTSVPAVSTAPDDLRHTVKQEYQPQGNQQAQVSTMETEAKDMSSTILAGISSDQQQSIMSSGSYVASTISAHNIPESKPAIATMTAKAVDTTAESLSRRESTTPGQISSTCGIDFVLDAESGIVKQQPRSLSTSDMQSDDHSTMDTGYTPTTAQTSIGQIAPPKQVIAKVERHRSSDYSVPSPYPVSKTPSQQDYTVKQVSRSLSLGADANLPQHASARSGVQEQIVLGTTRSVTPQYSQVTSKTKAAKPSKAEKNAVSKERALSVDSGLIAPATTVPSDDAKPASTSSLQMRPVQYPVTSQRNSRRARLWEQQPPPYSTQSSPSPATSGTTSFMYPAQIIHRHQVVPISGQRMQILSPGPHGMHSLQPAGPGVIAFQLEGSQAQGFPPGHLISQPRPPFPGHPMKGYQNPPGRYIELRHSNQSDPATRRQKILRMGNVYSSNQNQSQATPVVQSKDVSPTSEASSSDKAQEKQSDLPTSTTTATSVVDTKSVDPFVGGHIPHDEHLDALLRSDEFKHLHFQAAQGKLQDAAALQVATPASLASSLAAAVAAVNSPSLVTLTSQKSKKDKPSEGRKEDAVASATTGDGTKTTQTVPTVSNTSSNDSVSATNTTASNTLELKENEDEMVKKIEQNISEGKVPEDNQEGEKEEIVTESFIGILKSDHSYFKSSKSEEEPTVSVAVAKLPEAPSMEKDNVEDGDSGTKLRGVGLTPPPESELSQFVPTDENDMQQESSSALTVSNVITVPVVPDHRTLSPSPPNIFSKGTAVERDKMEIGKNILGAEGSEEKIKEYQVVIEDERTSMKTKEDDDKKDAVASSVQSTGEESKAVSEVSDQEMAGENVETKKTQLISSDDILSVQSEAAPSHYEKDKPGTDIILTSDDHLVPVDPVSSMVESTEKSSSEDGRGVLDKVSLESTQVPNDCDQNMVESREKATSETAHTETAEMKFTDDVDIRGIVEISSVEQKQVASSCITHTEGTTHDVTVEESKLEKTATENRSKDSDQCVSVPKQEDSQIPTSVTIKERVQQPPNPEKNSVLLCTSTGNVDATSTSESAVIEPSVTAPVEVKTREEIDKNAEVVSEDNLPKNTTTEYTASATAVPINRNSPTLVPKTSTSSQENILELAKTVIPTQFIISSHALDVTNSSSCVPTVSFQAIDSAECSHATTAPVYSTASAPASVVALPATVSATTMADTQTAAEILSASSVMQTVSQISTASNPGQVGQTPLLSTYTLATSTAVTPAVVPAVVSSATVPVSTVSQLTATTISVTTTTQPASVSSQSGTSTNTSPQNLLKKKHLLIKEQPLLLQELLEEEKREQERARLEKLRHSQSLLQQQAVVQPSTPAMFPVSAMELEKAAPDGGIDNIKMKFLSRINQAAQAGLPGVPPTAPIENVITPMHVPKTSGTPWQTHIASPALQQAGSQAQYTDWLIQHQQILQIQVQKHEQLFQMKKQRKQSLMKKRTQCKKSEGKKEFTQEEADELKAITKQCSETQQQLEKLRNSQKQHAELFQEFNIKQQCMVGIMHTAGSVGGTAGTVVGQQQPQMATVVDAQGQQQIMIQQRMPGQHVVVSQVQGPAGLQGQSVIPSQNMGMPHQLLMMQQSQQQLLIKSVPTSTSSVTSSPTPGTMTVQQQQQAPQQQQVVMASQQQQQQGIFSHMQKITGMRPNPAELQQLMMNQHQLHQQQQLQQQLQKQVIVGQPGLKAAQTRPHFISPQTSLASNQSLTTGGPSISGNQTHNAFMQMQMDQLLALQIEQQQQLAAMQQQMGADKPKTKRKRKKRKSQAEKEAEEQQQQQQLLAQQQHMQQNAMVGNLPITSQQQPTSGAFGGLWHHRPGIPQQQQHVMPNIRPQMTVQSRPMFSMPSQTLHIQPSGSGALPTSIVQVRHPGVTSLPPTNVIGAPSPMGQHGYTQQMAISKSSPLISTHHGVHHTQVSSATTVMSSVASSGPIVMASVTHPAVSCSGISTTVGGVTATTSALQALQRSIAGPVRVANNSAMAMTSSTTATTFVTASGIPTATPLSQQPSTVSIVNASSAHQMQFPQASQQQFSDSKIIKKDVCSSVSSGPTNKAETEKTAVTSAALPSPSMNSVHELATNSNTSTLSQIISESSTSTQVISSIIATSAGVPGSPRIHSPVLSNMENLSEAELAILMAHDPDLNKEEEAIRTMTGTTSTVLTPPSSSTPAPDQEEKSPKDEQKKKRRPKKGFVMDKRTIETINSSINNVIRLSLEYEDKLQAAKGAGTAVTTPSPWTLDPKPTKFPEKKSNQSSPSGLDDTSAKGGNKELLKHLLKTGQAGSAIANMPEAMYSQMTTGYGIQSSVAGGMLHMECYSSMPPEQLKMLKGMAPYLMKQTSAELVEAGQKKKRARRGSKEGGPDGAKGPKRRRKKDKNVIPQPAYTMSTTGQVPAMPSGMIMQAVGQQGTMIAGTPGTVGAMVPYVAPGAIGPVPATDISKPITAWKALPLLNLLEPKIRLSHHMCVPKGMGLSECRSLLVGEMGNSSFHDIPDFFNLLLDLEKESPPQPPTPPTSSPPSPTSKQCLQQVTGIAVHHRVANTDTTPSNAMTTMTDKTLHQVPGDQVSARYGPLGLSGEADLYRQQSPLVKIPDSLPTPPHQGIEDKEESSMLSKSLEDSIIPPSSPEIDDEDEWFPQTFTSLNREDATTRQLLHVATEEGNIRLSPSPDIPLLKFPKIYVPTDQSIKSGILNDKDSVSVTIEFDNTNIKSIEKSLTLLSKILDTSIISYSMVDVSRAEKKLKDMVVKEKQMNVPIQAHQNQAQKTTPEVEGMPPQHRCVYCGAVVAGNGVRKPQFDVSKYEEDVIFCNKECYLKAELWEKKTPRGSVKKKFKASHIYQRHTCKLNMTALLERFPEEDPLTPSKIQRGLLDTPTGVPEVNRGAGLDGRGRGRGRRRGIGGAEEPKVASKKWRGIKWKKWTVGFAVVKTNTKPPVDVDALLIKYGSALKPPPEVIDKRYCAFCNKCGDGDTHTVARLLNVDVDRWVHLNCALWSAEVYETQGGALINVDLALRRSESVLCCSCQRKGATIHCHRPRCINTYHCQCALDIKCVFFKDKTVLCPTHAPKPGGGPAATGVSPHQHHHSSDTLRSLAVFRKVYVQRPETKQIASIMQQGELSQGEKNYVLRVGALIFENVGQLATHQMAVCHSSTAIYPVGYKSTRIFWSSTNMRRRCRYECYVDEVEGKPNFLMKYKAALPGKNKPEKTQMHAREYTQIVSDNVNELWLQMLKPLEKLRSQHNVLKLFPAYINGEKLFGLTTPVVARILESLPNIELCAEYKFRYGRTPLLELPLAINPTGCARSEPHIKQHRKKPHTLISNLISEYYESSGIGDVASLYGKQFVHSKSSQYRKMKQEWRQNVYLARSRIQGLGLFSAKDIEPGTMVIEYIGDIIRIEVSEKREKMYESTNRGVYMFRLDSDHIVDATVTGGPARYINHSCNPNCVAEVVNFEKEKKIMIVSNRHILKGEELSYDYKFDFEDEGRKIPCLCGASNCKKWMN